MSDEGQGDVTRYSSRLDRIEAKLDSLADAVIAIARAEEKIISLTETTNGVLDRLIDYDSRMRTVEAKAADSESKLKSIYTFMWSIITTFGVSAASGIVWLIKQ